MRHCSLLGFGKRADTNDTHSGSNSPMLRGNIPTSKGGREVNEEEQEIADLLEETTRWMGSPKRLDELIGSANWEKMIALSLASAVHIATWVNPDLHPLAENMDDRTKELMLRATGPLLALGYYLAVNEDAWRRFKQEAMGQEIPRAFLE